MLLVGRSFRDSRPSTRRLVYSGRGSACQATGHQVPARIQRSKRRRQSFRSLTNIQIVTGIEVNSQSCFPKLREYCPSADDR